MCLVRGATPEQIIELREQTDGIFGVGDVSVVDVEDQESE